MKLRLTLIAAAMTLSGMALAAGEYSSPSDTSESAGVVEGGAESGASGSQSSLLSVIDRDGDGKITEEELTSHFLQSDANGDGSLDESEFAAFEGGTGGEMQMPSDQPASPDTGTMEQSPSDMGTSPDAGVPPASPGATGQ